MNCQVDKNTNTTKRGVCLSVCMVVMKEITINNNKLVLVTMETKWRLHVHVLYGQHLNRKINNLNIYIYIEYTYFVGGQHNHFIRGLENTMSIAVYVTIYCIQKTLIDYATYVE